MTNTPRSGTTRFLDSQLAQDTSFLLARASSRGIVAGNRHLEELNLRVRSYSVLSLACSGLNPTQRDLAEFLSLDPSQIVPLVDDLESRKLVARQQDPADRRSKIISATSAGKDLHLRAQRKAQVSEDNFARKLSGKERVILNELLARLAFEQE